MIQNNQKIPVLFTEQNSIYNALGCDTYDSTRNALTFHGSAPVIAHPPCRLWSRLRGLSTAPACEKLLAVYAVVLIQSQGGILEHPESSTLWREMLLPLPGKNTKPDQFSICVNQHWFGHPCRKKTLLYICGITEHELPPIPLNFDAIEFVVSSSSRLKNPKKEILKKARSSTPLQFALWLIAVQQLISSKKK